MEGIIDQGGTILRSSRTNPFAKGKEDQLQAVLANLKKFELDALIALGGEDTLGVASKLYSQHGVKTVGVPKTMDNDLDKTDYTFGFDSAASVALEVDGPSARHGPLARPGHRRGDHGPPRRLGRPLGRHRAAARTRSSSPKSRWTWTPAANTSRRSTRGARPTASSPSARACEIPGAQKPEDAQLDAFGHHQLGDVGIGPAIAKEIERRTGFPTRDVVLGHTVRGGSPTLFDRILGTRVGIKAAELVHSGGFGQMVAQQGTEIVGVPIEEAVKQWKLVPRALYDEFLTTFNK